MPVNCERGPQIREVLFLLLPNRLVVLVGYGADEFFVEEGIVDANH